MMNNLNKIIAKIEAFAPLELAEKWDNTGWQVYLGNKNIKKVMLALSPTTDVVKQAVDKGCELLITHHPLIFLGIKNLSTSNNADMAVIKAIQGGLQIYAAHTNLDSAEGGIADILAEKLDLQDVSPIEGSLGRIGQLVQPMELTDLADKIKTRLNTSKLKLINPSNIQKIKNIAVLPGSGGGLIPHAEGIDLYITGDVRYHDALGVKNFAVIDAGHFETEKIVLDSLEKLLQEFEIEIFIAKEHVPWEII